jgi:hypothetical protein
MSDYASPIVFHVDKHNHPVIGYNLRVRGEQFYRRPFEKEVE